MAGIEDDMQMKAIVIHFEESTNRAICFSKQLECLITVQLPLEMEAKRGQRIVFGDHDYSDSEEVYIPLAKLGHIKFENEESVRHEGNQILIRAMAAFSVQNNHPTYSKERAFAGAFGLVLVDPLLSSSMENGPVYECELAVNNFDPNDKETPRFRIFKVYPDIRLENVESFLNSMYNGANENPQTENEVINTSASIISERTEGSPLGSSNRNTPTERGTNALQNTQQPNDLSDDLSLNPTDVPEQTAPAANLTFQFAESISGARSTSSGSNCLSEDYQSGNRAGPSHPPKSFRFGKQVHNVDETQTTGNRDFSFPSHDKEIENCVLVLRHANGEIIGYETTLLKLMNLDVRNIDLPPISKFGRIRFIPEGSENGRTKLKEGKFSYSDPSENFVWSQTGGQICAQVVFSTNRNHTTFNKSCGFSNYYGFINIRTSSEYLERGKVYSTYIDIEQCENPLQPVFFSVSELKEAPFEFSDDFARTMCDFEQRIANETRNNGLSSSIVPRVRDLPRHKSYRKPDRTQIKGFQVGLLVSVDRVGRKYGKLLTQYGNAYFTQTPSYDQSGMLIQNFSWISVRLQSTDNLRDLVVLKVADPINDVRGTDVIRREDPPVLSASIELNSRLENRDNNIRYYRHPLMGIVQTETELDCDHNTSVPVKCYRRSEGVHLSTSKGEEYCFWYAEPNDSSSNSSQRRQSENIYNQSNISHGNEPDWNSRAFPPQDRFATPEKMKNISENIQRPCYTPAKNQNLRDDERGFDGDSNDYHGSSSRQFYADSSFSNFQCQPMHPHAYDGHPELSNHPAPRSVEIRSNCEVPTTYYEGRALVVSRRGTIMILYLLEKNRAAFIQWKKFDRIRLGYELQCRFVPVIPSEMNHRTSYEVIDIIEYFDGNFETQIKENDSLAVFEVDLNHPSPGYSNYTRRTGNFIFGAYAVGPVLMDNSVRGITNDTGSAAGIVEEYRGKDGSSEIMTSCLFTECLVPARMFDENLNDREEVSTYVWKIVQILTTKKYYLWNQEDLKRKNLGPDCKRIEREDDIDRQKKQAMQKYEEDNRRQGFMSSASSNAEGNAERSGMPPSNMHYTDWGSNHEQFVTPHGSVNNFGAGSSRSFHTANGSHTPVGNFGAGSSRSFHTAIGSHTPAGNGMPPNFHDGNYNQNRSDAPHTQSDRLEFHGPSDTDALYRAFRSMQDAISVFTNDREVRELMSTVSLDDLKKLENAIATVSQKEANRLDEHHR